MKFILTLILLLCLLTGITAAQELVWTHYDTSNSGITCNIVSAIAVDSSGNIWIGTVEYKDLYVPGGVINTPGGVSMFDGVNWTNYDTSNSGLKSNTIHSIAVDHEGVVWFGTCRGGVASFDGQNWTSYTTTNSELVYWDVPVVAIDHDGNKWFGYFPGLIYEPGGVSMFDRTNWIHYDPYNSGLASTILLSIAEDNDGNMWFGTLGGLSRFDGENWKTYKTSNSDIIDGNIYNITIDEQGNRWFGTGEGISVFDGLNWTNYDSTNSSLPSNYIHDIAIDREGKKWIKTAYGITVFDGINWQSYTTLNNRLTSGAIAIDKQENIWFATDGVTKLSFNPTNIIHDKIMMKPSAHILYPNYPNPFNSTTQLGFSLAQSDFVKLSIYNESGQFIRCLIKENKTVGCHAILWDGKNEYGQSVSSGIYFYTLKIGRHFYKTHRMALIK